MFIHDLKVWWFGSVVILEVREHVLGGRWCVSATTVTEGCCVHTPLGPTTPHSIATMLTRDYFSIQPSHFTNHIKIFHFLNALIMAPSLAQSYLINLSFYQETLIYSHSLSHTHTNCVWFQNYVFSIFIFEWDVRKLLWT